MRAPFPAAMRWMRFIAIPLVAVVIGVAVAIASSPASLSRGHVLGTPVPPSPSPSPIVTTPIPSVTEAGILGKSPQLVAAGAQSIVGLTSGRAAGTADAGKTWKILTPPAKASGVAIDPSNPLHGIAGGSSITFTTDGGTTWKPVQVAPPVGGPYLPLQISPFDGNVWFLAHGGKLLRTRDGGLTWRDIAGLQALTTPVLAAGAVFGQFYIASGNSVVQLIDNGQQTAAVPPLPSGTSVASLAVTGGGPANLVARAAGGGLYTLQGTQWVSVSGEPGGPIGAGAGGIVLVGDGGAKLGSPGAISYSSDAGSTWHQASGLPYDQSVEAIAGQPSSITFVAYCYGGDVYSSTDGGRTWALLSRALRNSSG
jgi:hypothetical protein